LVAMGSLRISQHSSWPKPNQFSLGSMISKLFLSNFLEIFTKLESFLF